MNLIKIARSRLSFSRNKKTIVHHKFDDPYHLQLRKIFDDAMIHSHDNPDLSYNDDSHRYVIDYVHHRFMAFVNRYNLALGVNKFYEKRWGYRLSSSSSRYAEYYLVVKEILLNISRTQIQPNDDIERIKKMSAVILEEGDLWPHSKIYNFTHEVRSLAINNNLFDDASLPLRISHK